MDLTNSLQKLAAYRPHKTPKSKETLEKGRVLLASNGYARQGDEGWEALEKTFLAALDEGDIGFADRCLQLLSDKFPGSVRIDVLAGIRMEATEPPDVALKYYNELLEADSSRAAAWRRKASVLRRMGKIDKSVEELSAMLDTFYTDVEGWLELADTYAACQQYTYALQSLSHALLLAPQNPSFFLQFAETAVLAADVPLALRMFLVAVDMTDDDDGPVRAPDTVPAGLALRAWFGVKLCTSRLVSEPRGAAASASHTASPDAALLANLNELATERLRTAYLDVKGASPPSEDKDLLSAVALIVQ